MLTLSNSKSTWYCDWCGSNERVDKSLGNATFLYISILFSVCVCVFGGGHLYGVGRA